MFDGSSRYSSPVRTMWPRPILTFVIDAKNPAGAGAGLVAIVQTRVLSNTYWSGVDGSIDITQVLAAPTSRVRRVRGPRLTGRNIVRARKYTPTLRGPEEAPCESVLPRL
jgi:hypothetical protein